MKINIDWLSDYFEIRETPQELADALTMAGLEVEGVEEVSGQTVLEVGVTPNRPDWLCHLGVAREAAAIFGRKLTLPETRVTESGPDVQALTSIDIEDPEGCPRYSGRVMLGITMGAAPKVIRERLESIGVRSISNVVDATNYVMMELGQPLHAFDYNRLAENRIAVRRALQGEVLETLDGQKRELDSSDLLICDGLGPVALAGIMGGFNSEVMGSTTDLLLESACFDPPMIRRSARRLGLSTEASYRFERGSDPSGTVRAVDRLAYLIHQWAGGEVCQGTWDAHPRPEEKRSVPFRMKRVSAFLGVEVPEDETVSALEKLELAPAKGKDGTWSVTVPGFRRDVSREEDVIEEVARLFGYDRIPVTMPVGRTVPVKTDPLDSLQAGVRVSLEGLDFSEAITYSFISLEEIDELGLGGGPDPVALMNPISEDMTVMRPSILPGILKALKTNLSHRVEEVRLYETGRVFLPCPDCELPEERLRVAGVMTGDRSRKSWYRERTEGDFFDVKGVVESLLDSLGIRDARFTEIQIPYLQPGQGAWVMAGEASLGVVGTIHPGLKERYRIKGWAGVFELDLHHLVAVDTKRTYVPIPQYPGVLRDLAVVVPKDVEHMKVSSRILQEGKNLGKVDLFDLYEGKGIPEDHKSLAYSLTYQSAERTLTDDEVDGNLDVIVKALEKEFGARLR
ncbi:MAG: phenylalanine--tRNA ligase subunit beta [bacterium]|nr:phenylalanine--tRNA ligase subunit beta [bacterium]